jgi:hypothetical protein
LHYWQNTSVQGDLSFDSAFTPVKSRLILTLFGGLAMKGPAILMQQKGNEFYDNN